MAVQEGETLSTLASKGTIPPDDFESCPERVSEIADIPLELPTNFTGMLEELRSLGIYSDEAIQDSIAALVTGNLILAGPPGTGKTKLAKGLAAAFGASLDVETANPEWSVYDVIGSQALNSSGGVLPRNGIVTRAILKCAKTTVAHLDTHDRPQANWLLIDELNRAEIDRAFGPLFTALSGGEVGSYTLDYIEGTPTISLPRRFRIIATINDYDTRFVNTMSAALRRRFARVEISPPANEADGGIPAKELSLAIEQSRQAVSFALSTAAAASAATYLSAETENLRLVFGAFRKLGDAGGIPIGPAQIIDCLTYCMVLFSSFPPENNGSAFWGILDQALSSRLVAGIESTQPDYA